MASWQSQGGEPPNIQVVHTVSHYLMIVNSSTSPEKEKNKTDLATLDQIYRSTVNSTGLQITCSPGSMALRSSVGACPVGELRNQKQFGSAMQVFYL